MHFGLILARFLTAEQQICRLVFNENGETPATDSAAEIAGLKVTKTV